MTDTIRLAGLCWIAIGTLLLVATWPRGNK